MTDKEKEKGTREHIKRSKDKHERAKRDRQTKKHLPDYAIGGDICKQRQIQRKRLDDYLTEQLEETKKNKETKERQKMTNSNKNRQRETKRDNTGQRNR